MSIKDDFFMWIFTYKSLHSSSQIPCSTFREYEIFALMHSLREFSYFLLYIFITYPSITYLVLSTHHSMQNQLQVPSEAVVEDRLLRYWLVSVVNIWFSSRCDFRAKASFVLVICQFYILSANYYRCYWTTLHDCSKFGA